MEKSKDELEKLKKSVEAASSIKSASSNDLLKYIDDSIAKRLDKVLHDSCAKIETYHEIELRKDYSKTKVIHYTGIDVIVSMLQNVAEENAQDWLRLYDSVHLNDPDEGNYIVRWLPEEYAWLKKKDLPHAYIASFIIPSSDHEKKMEDNLVFWRTYGKQGEGCSLSLSVPCSQLKRVIYGKEKTERTIKLLNPVLDCLEPLIDKEPIREELSRIVWKHLDRFRYLYKSEAHEYENECRFVVGQSELKAEEDEEKIRFEFQYQNGSSPRVRHYYEHEKLAVKNLLVSGSTITLGPCVDYPYNMRYYLESLKKRANLLGPEIRISRIPYRKS